MVDLSVVVPSHNTRETLLECIAALKKAGGVSMEVWVVDNASSDGSADAVASGHPDVRLIRNPENRGFAAACNQGIGSSTGRCVLLLNSDAFVEESLPAALVRFMDEHPEAGAVGCRLLNPDGTVQPSCFRTPNLAQAVLELSGHNARRPGNRFNRAFRILDWGYDTAREVDCVAGACMGMRREAMEQIGGLDERYFLYFEDFDWCRRARAAGWKVLYCPEARAVHIGGVSAALAKQDVGAAPIEGLRRYMCAVNEDRPVARAMVAAAANGWIAATTVKRIIARRGPNGRRGG